MVTAHYHSLYKELNLIKQNHFGFIDALRGYAILVVIAVHTSQCATAWGGFGRQIVDQGARGV